MKNVFALLLITSVLCFMVMEVACAQRIVETPGEKHDTLNASRVTAERLLRDNTTQTGLVRLDEKKINQGFALFGSPDIIKKLQTLPGVASGTELLSGLYVHGGDGSDNLFLLDGVPIYQVSHLCGLFSSFNTDVVESLDFYKSGFPARYGGRLSSVVDVSTREGSFEKVHGGFSIGLIDGRFNLEGPIVKGRTSFNFGIRRTWLDAITIPILAIENRKYKDDSKLYGHYQMNDTNLKITHLLSSDSKLHLNLYYGDDALRLGKDEYEKHDIYEGGTSMDDDGNPKVPLRTVYGMSGYDVRLRWGNFVSSFDWEKAFSDRLHSRLRGFYTLSHSRIYFDVDEWDYADDADIHEIIKEENLSKVHDFGFNADFDFRPSSRHHIRGGGTFQWHIYTPSRDFLYKTTIADVDTDKYEGHEDADYDGAEVALYVEDELSLSRRLKANVGLRYSLYPVKGRAYHSIEPRLALKYQAGDFVSLKASYSEMSQFAHLVSSLYLDLPTNCWMPSTAEQRPMKSRQVSAGVYAALAPRFNANVELYYKTMNHLLEYSDANILFPPLTHWEQAFSEGRGRAYGAEFELSYEAEKTSLTACYTLSWSKRFFPGFCSEWYLDRNDNRHKITLTATQKFGKKCDIYASWNYHTGNRVTFPSHLIYRGGDWRELYDAPNNTKMPDYHRFDLGFNFRRITRRGKESVLNLSIYNAYCRVNPIFASVDVDNDGHYFGVAMGIIPIIPTLSYSIKF